MNIETLDKYIITYSNWFEFNGVVLAYRKRILFDITGTPKPLTIKNNKFILFDNQLNTLYFIFYCCFIAFLMYICCIIKTT